MNVVLRTKNVHNVLQVIHLSSSFNEIANFPHIAFHGLRNLVNILRLDDSLQVVFQDFCEVVYRMSEPSCPLDGLASKNILCNSEPRKYLKISSQSGGLSYRPRLGFSFPLRIFNAVLLPIPLVPTRPRTCPGRGIGNR